MALVFYYRLALVPVAGSDSSPTGKFGRGPGFEVVQGLSLTMVACGIAADFESPGRLRESGKDGWQLYVASSFKHGGPSRVYE